MRYEKQTVLTHDENPFGGKDYDVDPFMVGDLAVLSWKEEDSRGVESHSIHPAYSASPDFAESKGRCWHHVWSYEATERGNQSRGYGAELMPFVEGVKILVEHDVFSFPAPQDDRKRAYEQALQAWRQVYRGAPGKQPLPAAFGLKDLQDPCSVCAHLEAAYEYSYDLKEIRIIPSGFPDGEQIANQRLCLPCASKRHGVEI